MITRGKLIVGGLLLLLGAGIGRDISNDDQPVVFTPVSGSTSTARTTDQPATVVVNVYPDAAPATSTSKPSKAAKPSPTAAPVPTTRETSTARQRPVQGPETVTITVPAPRVEPEEDSGEWDCRTMGNRTCGSDSIEPTTSALSK